MHQCALQIDIFQGNEKRKKGPLGIVSCHLESSAYVLTDDILEKEKNNVEIHNLRKAVL